MWDDSEASPKEDEEHANVTLITSIHSNNSEEDNDEASSKISHVHLLLLLLSKFKRTNSKYKNLKQYYV